MTYKRFMYEILCDYTKFYNVTSIDMQQIETGEYAYVFKYINGFSCCFRTIYFIESFILYQKGESTIKEISFMMQQVTMTFFCIENNLIDKNEYWKGID